MQPKDILDLLVFVSAVAVAVTVGSTNIKKQTIADLQALVQAHELTIANLKNENTEQAEEIRELRETVDGYSELVRQGYLAGGNRQSSGNSSASTKTSKNRSP